MVKTQGQVARENVMGYSAQYLSNEEWMKLHAAYKAHGSGSGFWQVYQELQITAQRRTGDPCVKVANEMARMAAKLGATAKAIFV
ncbi:MAG: hypothetical protein DI584_01500 [Stenotrophomonas sp.]|nr:MAG: hypothetical protein DI584_01500 [Stenotrophomonas sp.]